MCVCSAHGFNRFIIGETFCSYRARVRAWLSSCTHCFCCIVWSIQKHRTQFNKLRLNINKIIKRNFLERTHHGSPLVRDRARQKIPHLYIRKYIYNIPMYIFYLRIRSAHFFSCNPLANSNRYYTVWECMLCTYKQRQTHITIPRVCHHRPFTHAREQRILSGCSTTNASYQQTQSDNMRTNNIYYILFLFKSRVFFLVSSVLFWLFLIRMCFEIYVPYN